MTSQIIHLNEGDVKVAEHFRNEWSAWEINDIGPVGYGSTMIEAIADLNEKLKERE